MQHKFIHDERLFTNMIALSCFAIFQYGKSLWPCHRVQAADRCTVKVCGRSPGPFVDKTPLWAIDIVAHVSLQKFRHEWWNIRPIETKFGVWKLRDSVYHSCEPQSIMINNFCAIFLWDQAQQPAAWDSWSKIYKIFKTFGHSTLLRRMNF